MFVLDVLRHDEIENVPAIVRMLNDDGGIGWRDQWDRDFTEADVRSVLVPLVRDGLLLALREKADTDGFDEIDETDLSGRRRVVSPDGRRAKGVGFVGAPSGTLKKTGTPTHGPHAGRCG